MNILPIDSSMFGQNSIRRQLSWEAVKRLLGAAATSKVRYRDPAVSPLPHLSGSYLQATQSADGARDPDVRPQSWR